ncbi:cyclic AMP-dependent transcription factor ATF-6 beta [Sitophilus oryzae]|uniref:Cyclic AMP-dependent transcription factor ATF-6 beta n=1 Tax=Sitophilus oryzae TaxID=7048 RepID=A0A6J2X4J8_SITOR|nr:cyclic AMP-dependent transcription factor ATF-6 beta [Sitophilus oryzae]
MWPDFVGFNEDYGFKSSPESSSDNSFCTDNMDVSSGEDFLTQLSTDLDIPLLLNAGEDEMALLNSFLDKSPDEILSDVASPPREDVSNDSLDVKDVDFTAWDFANIPKTEEQDVASDASSVSSNSIESTTRIPVVQYPPSTRIKLEEIEPKIKTKVPIKRVPIQPKGQNNFVVINNKFPTVLPQGISGLSPKVVVLDNISTFPVKQVSPILPNRPCNMGIDPKIFKRQQRKIKNRESACLSRKKKKDYLNSLEEQVKELVEENKCLKKENALLKDRLSYYEEDKSFKSISSKGTKPALVLCAFLLVVGLNLDYLRSPFLSKSNKIDLAQSKHTHIPLNHHGRGLLWADDQNTDPSVPNSTYFSALTMCPASINQSESARLLLELERWIGKPEITPEKKSPATVLTTRKPKTKRKKIRVDSSLVQVLENKKYGPENESKNEIQVFTPKPEQLYSEFFEAINRQEDTFYVVSFSEQHLLVPALYHNKTRRPKMTLLMPSVLPNGTSTQTFVPLMQIDCEVLDTKLVNVKYGAIPRQYRNVTKTNGNDEHRKSNSTVPRKNRDKGAYKPYFLGKKFFKMDDIN